VIGGIDVLKEGDDLLVVSDADRAKKRCDRDFALAIDLDREYVLVGGLELEPGAAAWNQLAGAEKAAGGGVLFEGLFLRSVC
jgi:hypothetical protein